MREAYNVCNCKGKRVLFNLFPQCSLPEAQFTVTVQTQNSPSPPPPFFSLFVVQSVFLSLWDSPVCWQPPTSSICPKINFTESEIYTWVDFGSHKKKNEIHVNAEFSKLRKMCMMKNYELQFGDQINTSLILLFHKLKHSHIIFSYQECYLNGTPQ